MFAGNFSPAILLTSKRKGGERTQRQYFQDMGEIQLMGNRTIAELKQEILRLPFIKAVVTCILLKTFHTMIGISIATSTMARSKGYKKRWRFP